MNASFLRVSPAVLVGLLFFSFSAHSAPQASPERNREFLFSYGATVGGLQKGQTARIWLPVPPSNKEQEVTLVGQRLPAKAQFAKEPKFGNEILYLEAKADGVGKIRLDVSYRVKRNDVTADFKTKVEEEEDVAPFLKPDAKVPVGGKPLSLLKGVELPHDQVELARVLYDTVSGHMKYSKDGVGWGQGDAVWACDSKYGNCSDFHSLFISLCRSQRIPAKFEMGFSLPERRGKGEITGYHCWAKFKPHGKAWACVDISEASKNPKLKDFYFGNLTENRVSFSLGRDLTLVPKQDGLPLNYFIYPYVEVEGNAWADDKIQPRFAYQDVDDNK